MKKSNKIQIRCTDQIKEMIEYASKKQDKTISEYVLDLIKLDLMYNPIYIKKEL